MYNAYDYNNSPYKTGAIGAGGMAAAGAAPLVAGMAPLAIGAAPVAAGLAYGNYIAKNPHSTSDYARGNKYHYTGGDSEDTFIKKNAFGKESGYGFTNFLNPIQGLYNGVHGKAVYKRQRAEYEENMRNFALQYQQRDYGRQQDIYGRQQYADNQDRQQTIDALDRAYQSPERNAARNAQYDTSLANDVAGINYNYGQQSQSAGLNAIRRGQYGSSTDAETQAGLTSNAQMATVSAQQQAANQKSSLEDQDRQQYEALRRALLSGDPQAAQQYQAQAQGSSDTINRILQGSAADDRQRLLNAMGMQNTVNLAGNVANAGASGVYGYYGNPQYG